MGPRTFLGLKAAAEAPDFAEEAGDGCLSMPLFPFPSPPLPSPPQLHPCLRPRPPSRGLSISAHGTKARSSSAPSLVLHENSNNS